MGVIRTIQVRIFVGREEEQLVLLKRTPHRESRINVLAVSLRQTLDSVEEILRRRIVVLEISVDAAMEPVSAALGDQVDGAAVGEAEFDGKSLALALVFLTRILRY